MNQRLTIWNSAIPDYSSYQMKETPCRKATRGFH
jgi:hypothetical protein